LVAYFIRIKLKERATAPPQCGILTNARITVNLLDFVVIMRNIIELAGQINWGIVIVLCATLGLAPFSPPHVIEKLSMLIEGRLIKPIDWFDLFLHGFPWMLLVLKAMARLMKKE
jgi:hypothetical protein